MEENAMNYKRAGQSGLKLPLISLGLWQHFGGESPFATVRAIVKKAYEAGITHFDLANNYGRPPGSAEENLGRILKEDPWFERDKVVVSTKAGFGMWAGPYGDGGSRKHLLASLEQSLDRLGTDFVDIFYSHRYDPETPLEETMGALHDAKRLGKATYIGLSNYPQEKLAEAIRILKDLGTPPILYQGHYSLLDQGLKKDGTLDLLQEEGVGFIPYAIFNHGLLTTKYLEGIPEASRAKDPEHPFLEVGDLQDDLLAALKNLHEKAEGQGATLTHLALRHVLSTPGTISALVGVRNEKQLNDHLEGLAKDLSALDPGGIVLEG